MAAAAELHRAGHPSRSARGAQCPPARTHAPSTAAARRPSAAFVGVAAPAELAAEEAAGSACAGRGPALRAAFARQAT